ncbi:MAG: tyrosine-type recombinase/integrase [Oscillospiraceae bacterium]|nr:tyrosine-type recombinase/integrase [Oscillospiraceae bacterium]
MSQKQNKARMLDIYQDYGLVFAQENGRPITNEMVSDRWKAFLRKQSLRKVSFYSLRHSGATAKLLASHDIKAVQGDMGHSSTDMAHEPLAPFRTVILLAQIFPV